jgi:hypothetical protein
MRQVRNDLVHGRWVAEPLEYRVLNVVTTADMMEQRSTPYTLGELEEMANEVQSLQVELAKLLRRNEI